MFGMENLLDEKDMYPYLHREMFGRHMSRYICRTFILLGFSPLHVHERKILRNLVRKEAGHRVSFVTNNSME